MVVLSVSFFFFFNDTATTEIYTLSLHDALPICLVSLRIRRVVFLRRSDAFRQKNKCILVLPSVGRQCRGGDPSSRDRKSTRLNSSHSQISYAVFCLKKKNTIL